MDITVLIVLLWVLFQYFLDPFYFIFVTGQTETEIDMNYGNFFAINFYNW